MIAFGLFLLRLGRLFLGLREKLVAIDGVSWVYSEGGVGEPLVLLHGLGANRATFDAVSVWLARRCRLIIPDLPGFGESGPAPDGDYGVEAQVARLDRFVARLGLTRFHLGGNSMGGGIAAAYAALHPEKVGSLWLLAAAGTRAMLESEVVRARREEGAYLLLPRDVEEFSAVLDRIFHQPPPLPNFVRWAGARMAAEKFDLHSRIFDQLLEGGDAERLEPLLSRVAAPTLLVWGERDTVVPLTVLRRFEALLPDARVVVMPGVGHVPQMEAPRRTAEDYLAFRDELGL